MNVLITGFHVANRPVKKGDKSGNNVITDTAVMDTEQFTLAYNENTFSIDFSVLEFSNPDRISYQYKIKELGDEWISTQPGTNRVTYSSLNRGNTLSPYRHATIIISLISAQLLLPHSTLVPDLVGKSNLGMPRSITNLCSYHVYSVTYPPPARSDATKTHGTD